MVFSADYLRNVETRTLLAIDVNKVGDISTFNMAGAQAAIAATNAQFGGCATVDCAIKAGATIDDYVVNGLGTPNDVNGVGCAQSLAAGGLGQACAFGGVNSMQNQAFFLTRSEERFAKKNVLSRRRHQETAGKNRFGSGVLDLTSAGRVRTGSGANAGSAPPIGGEVGKQ